MKAAIWGAGNIAETHAQALKAAGIPVTAVVDIDEGKAEALAKRWNIPLWGRDSAVLYAPDITSVHVCTPPNLHYEMTMSLLDAGKHVFCEKPLCFEDAQADDLVRKAEERGLVCATNFNVRFHPACQKAKEVVASPDFGPVMLVHGSYLQQFNCFPAPLDWRYNSALAGRMRAVTEIGTHWMDIAQYVSGKPVAAVSALFGRFHPKRWLKDGLMHTSPGENRREMEVVSEDAAFIHMRFEGGAIGSVVLSEVSQGRVNRVALEVTGEHRSLWWNAEENNLLHTARRDQGVNTEIFAFGGGFTDTFHELMEQYYDAVRAGKTPHQPVYPTFRDGARIVKICNALLESDANGSKWVEIPQ